MNQAAPTYTVVKAIQTCWACPSQWDAWTDTGQYLYLRYRGGRGTVSTGGDDGMSEVVASFCHGDSLEGSITLEKFAELARLELALRGDE